MVDMVDSFAEFYPSARERFTWALDQLKNQNYCTRCVLKVGKTDHVFKHLSSKWKAYYQNNFQQDAEKRRHQPRRLGH